MIDGNKLIEAIQGLMQPATTPVATPTEDKETHIAFVLDTSGSMQRIASDVIGMVNRAYAEARTMEGEAGKVFVSLVLFGIGRGDIKIEFSHEGVAKLTDLDRTTYRPQGSTPMYDGMGIAIGELERYDDGVGNKAFLVSTFTDGDENSSREWSGPRLSAKITELKANGRWTFSVAGANIDVEKLARDINLDRGSVVAYAATDTGVQTLGGQHVNSMRSYSTSRGMGGQSVGSFYAPEPTTDAATPWNVQPKLGDVKIGGIEVKTPEQLLKEAEEAKRTPAKPPTRRTTSKV